MTGVLLGKVGVVGLGRSGVSAARLLASSGNEVRVSELQDTPTHAAIAAELAELGVTSVLDLLTHYPRRYIDGTRLA
ncbi:MAG: hypothetical protein ACRDJU_09845, partial [Actinomycetota bacterium]